MSASTEAPVTTDLSQLTKREQLNARVAETQGYRWNAGPLGRLSPTVPGIVAVFEREDGRQVAHLELYQGKTLLHTDPDTFPDYAGDPAAWGALMEREGIGVKQLGWREKRSDLYWWGATAWSSDGMMHLTHTVETPGEAVCFSILAKHGIDPSPYIGD
jgi:hypothetical protein